MKVLLLSLCSIAAFTSMGQFEKEKPLTSIASSSRPSFVVDINSDGNMDIVYYNQYGIQWSNHDEEGDYNDIHNLYTYVQNEDDRITSFAAEDIDGDGDIDIAFGTHGVNGIGIGWLANSGEGEFEEYVVLVEDVNVKRIYFEDLDVDGDLDLMVNTSTLGDGDLNSRIFAVENIGAGEFGVPIIIDAYEDQRVSNCGDIDGDGDLDIAVGVHDINELYWYENLGGMSFGSGSFVSSDFNKMGNVKIGDMDQDGDQDIVFTTLLDAKVAWQENTGGGVFGDQHLIGTFHSTCLLVEDIDGDTDIDLIIDWADGEGSRYVGPIEHSAPGVFEEPIPLTTVGYNISLSYADINMDGLSDIIVPGPGNGRWSYLPGLGGISFGSPIKIIGFHAHPNNAVSVDLDGDGDREILSVSSLEDQIIMFNNEGSGQYGPFNTISSEFEQPDNSIALDMDGDGDKDIIASGIGLLAWFENLGDTFGLPTLIPSTVSFTRTFLLADLDSDGDEDLIRVVIDESKVCWFENTGSGLGPEIEIEHGMDYVTDIEAGDFDNDGDLDLILVGSDVYWMENLDGTFAMETLLFTDLCSNVVLGDFNNDGLIDIAGASNAEVGIDLFWFENLGDGSVGSMNIIYDEPALTGIHIDAADVDLDGNIDLFLSTAIPLFIWDIEVFNSNLFFFRNLEGGVFSYPNLISGNFYVPKIDIEDMDGDGDVDIFVASAGKISFYRNGLTAPNQVKGNLFFDENENGIKDIDEPGFGGIQVQSIPMAGYSYTYPNGDYSLNFDEAPDGIYTIQPEPLDHWYITTAEDYEIEIDDDFTGLIDHDFGFFPDDSESEIEVSLIGGAIRCDGLSNIWIDYRNIGGVIANGVISVDLSEDVTYIEADIAEDSIVDGTVFWSYTDLFYFEERAFKFVVEGPDVDLIGDTLLNSVNITSIDGGGVELFAANDSIDQVVTCAYDPNDKTVSPRGKGDLGEIPPTTEHLEYTIRFQNTGTDTAFNIVITDQLDSDLEWTSIDLLGSSHEMTTSLSVTGELVFTFNDIMLPDSNVNELGSQGFVKYRIDLKPDLPIGTVINNTGFIYFDANPAIVTNTTVNTIALDDPDNTGIEDQSKNNNVLVYPNPFSDFTTVVFDNELTNDSRLIIYDILGQEVYYNDNLSGSQLIITKQQLEVGTYLLQLMQNDNSVFTTKLVVQ